MYRLIRKIRKELYRPFRRRVTALVEQVTAVQCARLEDLRIQNTGLQDQFDLLRSQCELLRSQYDGAREQRDRLCEQIRLGAEQNDQMRRDVDVLHEQIFALERLLTGTRAARAPGAIKAVSALGNPAVAVIVPTFNRPKFISEAIESVRQQSFEKWELVIVGDGCGEETAAAVAPFLVDPRIKFVRQERGGSAKARNRGISETRAPLIAYLDDDNLWYPDFLARATDCMATRLDVDVLYGALVTYVHALDRSCILWRPFSRERLLAGNFIDTSVIVHRRTLVGQYGTWDSTVNRLCDWDLMLRYTAQRPAYALDVLAANYRVCDDRRTSTLISDEATKAEILRRMASAS